jgi:hypothetical protein
MLRRRFIASAVAGLAGLFGLKAVGGEGATREPIFYMVFMRLSDGEIVKRLARGRGCDDPCPVPIGDACVVDFAGLDRVVSCSSVGFDHAAELAEAARLRYVITSAMR